jgi:hypothetical protein
MTEPPAPVADYSKWKRLAADNWTPTGTPITIIADAEGDDYTMQLRSPDVIRPASLMMNAYFEGKAHPKLHYSMRINKRHADDAQVCCGQLWLRPYEKPVTADIYEHGFTVPVTPDLVVTRQTAQLETGVWHDVVIFLKFSPNEDGRSSLITTINGEVCYSIDFPKGQMARLSPIRIHGVDADFRDFKFIQHEWDF